MTRSLAVVRRLGQALHGIAGASLVFLMLLTIADVGLRACRTPIPGTYELVGFAGALAIGFSLPATSWVRGHVQVDFLLGRLAPSGRAALHVFTRLLAAGLFGLLAWNLVQFGLDLRASGEVSPTLELRYYPVAFGLAAASILQAVVLLCDLARLSRGGYE